jgi:transcriptional regulator with PAS, ATPase and Fis domain
LKKIRPSDLLKFLQTIRQPIYILNSESEIIFCNRSLEEWTGCEASLLIGERLQYRTPLSRKKQEIVAAALSPPPECLQNKRCRVLLTMDKITYTSRRYAEFIPLEPSGLLVLADANEAGADDIPLTFIPHNEPQYGILPSAERQSAAELHQALSVMKRRQAGRYRWERMVGASQTMQRIRRLGRLTADSNAGVLITGEEGTGKQHLASAIHYSAGELAGAFVPVECKILDEDLLSTTVNSFRRYYSGQTQQRHTLLLKDADALPSSFLPLLTDWHASQAATVRLIATSVLPPEQWNNHPSIALLLGTIQISLPPLRQRKDDIPILAQLFLEENNAAINSDKVNAAAKSRAGFTSDALDLLIRYDWKGNLDELERCVIQAFANGSMPLISADELPENIRRHSDMIEQPAVRKKINQEVNLDTNLAKQLEQREEELIRYALKVSRNNKAKAAKMLGLTRPKLYRRMELLGIVDNG